METLVTRIQQAEAAVRGALAIASSTALEDQITALQPLAEQVARTPSVENVSAWLSLQDPLVNCALEGVVEVTDRLAKEQPDLVARALDSLPEAARIRLSRLLDELAGHTAEADIATAAAAEAISPLWFHDTAAPLPTGIMGRFIGTSSFTSTRGFPVKCGTMEITDVAGQIHHYAVNTGGGAATYTQRNAWLPPGVYKISNHRPNRDTEGMVLNDVGYSFDVDPADGTEVFGRSLFRIHPDGGSPGTNGCLGVRESADRLSECEQIIAALITSNGSFRLAVSYAA